MELGCCDVLVTWAIKLTVTGWVPWRQTEMEFGMWVFIRDQPLQKE